MSVMAPFELPDTTTAAPAIGPRSSETTPVTVLFSTPCANDGAENKTFSAMTEMAAKHQKSFEVFNVLFIEPLI